MNACEIICTGILRLLFFPRITQFPDIRKRWRKRWRTTLVFMFEKLAEITVPRLTGGKCAEQVKLVFLDMIIRSLNQALLHKGITLVFADYFCFTKCFQRFGTCFGTCNILCVQYNQLLALFDKGITSVCH